MRYVIWTFRLLLAAIVVAFLHYTLPDNDVVRIVGHEVRRTEVGSGFNRFFWNSAEPTDPNAVNRDVKFISAITVDGSPRVYRNEDTGWGWPPYFKFDSADVQANAADLMSTKAQPQWVRVKHYGWRNQLFSIYPNALNLDPVERPDAMIIPWFNIVFLGGFAALLIAIWSGWRRFRRKRIDPIVRDVSEAFEPRETKDGLPGRPYRGSRMKLREWWTETFG